MPTTTGRSIRSGAHSYAPTTSPTRCTKRCGTSAFPEGAFSWGCAITKDEPHQRIHVQVLLDRVRHAIDARLARRLVVENGGAFQPRPLEQRGARGPLVENTVQVRADDAPVRGDRAIASIVLEPHQRG